MATIKQEFESLKIRINKGEGNKVIHVVDHEAERERKIKNPQKSTKVYIDCRSPEVYKDLQIEKERFFSIAVDPNIAIHLLIRALHEVSDEKIRGWMKEGEEDERAELDDSVIPDWMKP